MTPSVLVGCLSLIGSLAGTFGGILASNRLTVYRIEQLEKKVDRHNNVVERMSVAEHSIKVINHRLEDLEHEEKCDH